MAIQRNNIRQDIVYSSSFQPIFSSDTHQPFPGTASTSAGSSGTDSPFKKTVEGINTALLNALTEKALYADVQEWSAEAVQALSTIVDPLTGQLNTTSYKFIVDGISRLSNAKEEYDKALQHLVDEDAIDEIAVGPANQVYVQTADGNITSKLIGDVDYSKERILTNGEIARYRKELPMFSFRNDMITAMSNGTNMQSITKYIRETLQGLGNNEVQQQFALSQEDAQALMQGIQGLQNIQLPSNNGSLQGLTLPQIYKVSQLSQTQIEQANNVLNWIASSLVKPNMYCILQDRANKLNTDINTLLLSLVNSRLSSKSSFSIDEGKNGSGSGSSDSSPKLHEAVQWLHGYGQRERVVFQKGNVNALSVSANVMPITHSGRNIGRTTLDYVTTSDFAGMFNMEQASMADQFIPYTNLQNVVVNGDSLYKMDLPYTYDQNGRVKPNLAFLEKIEEAEQMVKDQGAQNDPQKINAIYQQLGLPIKYMGNTMELTNNYMTFGVLDGYTEKRNLGDDFDIAAVEDMIKYIKDDFSIQEFIATINRGRSEKDRIKYEDGPFWNRTKGIVQSCVFIPIRTNFFNANAGNNNPIGADTATMIIEPKQQQNDRLNNFRSGGMTL